MTNESEDYNHPMRVVHRDLLWKHLVLARKGDEEARAKLFDFILEYENLYYGILKDDIQPRST